MLCGLPLNGTCATHELPAVQVLHAAPDASVWSGVAALTMGVPCPAFHLRMCRTAPEALLSTYATFVPSEERIGDVDAGPVLLAAVW